MLSGLLSGCGAAREAEPAPLRQTVGTEIAPEEEPLTLDTIRTVTFTDVAEDSIWRDTVSYIAYHGIMNGTGGGKFSPNAMVNRAMIAKVLYEMNGGEALAQRCEFSDVAAESWYAEAVAWCLESGMMQGVSETEFAPLEPVTRAQLAVILHRAAGAAAEEKPEDVIETEMLKVEEAVGPETPEPVGEVAIETETLKVETVTGLAAYTDGSEVPEYAAEAMEWALNAGIYRCMIADTILPDMALSRVQLAQALVALRAITEGDELAAEIHAALPARDGSSAAEEHHDDIQAAVDAAAQKYHATGVQVAVIEGGEVVDTCAYGWATKGSDPMTADHKMRVASISKVIVGMTAQALREEGVINLDTSIGEYWDMSVKNPAYPNTPITIRTMLTHTSSIFNAGDNEPRSYSAVKARLAGTGFSRSVPGDIGYWSYNNYAFGVLGMTLELASDRLVDDIMDEHFYSVMDIDASFAAGDIKGTDKLVTLCSGGTVTRSTDAQKNIHCASTPGANGTYFAGGLTISAADLGKLIGLLASDGRYEGVQLLSEESVALMETTNPTAVPGGSYQALPMRYWPALYGREGVYFHTGSAYGVYNCASYDPLTGDGVVVLTVGASGAKDDYGIYKICAEINDFVYGTIG